MNSFRGSTPGAGNFGQERYVQSINPQAKSLADNPAGNVFEKRLIEAYIAENGKDPVTGEELTKDDLIEVKTARTVRPRPPTLTSIPSLLGVFQEEWDALALETFKLRQALAQTRQELSTALYQHDAAVRVIARLTKERDEAREALAKISVSAARPAGGDAMQVDSTGLPQSVVARIDSTQERWDPPEARVVDVMLTFPGCRKLEASVRFRRAGRRVRQFSRSSPRPLPSPCTPVENHLPWTLRVIVLLSAAWMELPVSTRFLKERSYRPSRLAGQ